MDNTRTTPRSPLTQSLPPPFLGSLARCSATLPRPLCRYIDRFIPELIDYDAAQVGHAVAALAWCHLKLLGSPPTPAPPPQLLCQKLENSTEGQDILTVVGDAVIAGAVLSWNSQVGRGVWPPELIEEMRGVVAGCQAANPHTRVSFDRLITINYGFDWISAMVFGGWCFFFCRSLIGCKV